MAVLIRIFFTVLLFNPAFTLYIIVTIADTIGDAKEVPPATMVSEPEPVIFGAYIATPGAQISLFHPRLLVAAIL